MEISLSVRFTMTIPNEIKRWRKRANPIIKITVTIITVSFLGTNLKARRAPPNDAVIRVSIHNTQEVVFDFAGAHTVTSNAFIAPT